MNISAISANTWLGKCLRWPLQLLPKGMVVPIMQGKLRGMKWIVGSSVHGCWLGSYEYEKRRLFEKIIKPDNIVFDIGAHVGFYTILAAVLVGPAGKVIAFEPAPRNLFFLREHLRLNHITNARVIEAAVWDRDGLTTFMEGASSSVGHISEQGNLLVKTLSLDYLIREKENPPHFIKIDAEGAELAVLRGAAALLENNSPTLFLSTHGRELHTDCCHLLLSLGYGLRPVTGSNWEETDEIIAWHPRSNPEISAFF